MANCHDLFSEFHSQISISGSKRDRLINSKNGLRRRIREWFRLNKPKYEPKFYIQGSYKMKTTIRTKDDVCDLDDGVYFFRQPDVTATTLQGWVREAVEGYTSTDPEHRKKCVRSIFSADYEIDHPVYYKVEEKEYQLAVKNEGFEDSDSRGVVTWFNEKKDRQGKLVRCVKYLKAWCDNIRDKMPNGLSVTILASRAKERIVLNDRDDITLRDILKEIKKELDKEFKCIVPSVPGDDLFAGYSEERKEKFLSKLQSFINDADQAIREENQYKSSRLWRKHLGDRFPDGNNENVDSNSRNTRAIVAGASASKPWGM